MSLYLEYKVKTDENNVIIGISYHQQLGLLVILSCTENDQTQILICDELVSKITKLPICIIRDNIFLRVRVCTTLGQMFVKAK